MLKSAVVVLNSALLTVFHQWEECRARFDSTFEIRLRRRSASAIMVGQA